MRVGILAHLLCFRPGYRQAGVSRYVEHLLRALPAVDPDDEFVVFAGPAARHPEHERYFPAALRWATTRLPTERPPVRIAWEQAVGPRALRRARIDVAHAPVNVGPIFSPAPSVVTVHDLSFLHYPEQYPGMKQRYLNLLTRLSVERADRVIAVSESTRQDVLRFYRVASERVATVPNGLDPSFRRIEDRETLAAFRARHGLPTCFILFVGTLQPRKNLVGLLRAYARLLPRLDVPLVVVGAKGWLYEGVFQEARALGVSERVVFAGYAPPEDLPLWYAAASVFVYPSLYEGFGLPVIEAMACGTPVVTSNTSSLPEVAGEAALLVDPTDPDALAEAIERALTDEALRWELKERGYERARRFNWERTARETVAVYRAAAGR